MLQEPVKMKLPSEITFNSMAIVTMSLNNQLRSYQKSLDEAKKSTFGDPEFWEGRIAEVNEAMKELGVQPLPA